MNKILVSSSNLFTKYKASEHFITGPEAVVLVENIRRSCVYKERTLMEENESYRQIIPYVLVQDSLTNKFLFAKRLPKQTEVRLHDKLGLIGGHVEYCETPRSALRRELKEEIGIDTDDSYLQGVIITNTDKVDRVHVGFLYHTIVSAVDVKNPETGSHEFMWLANGELEEHYNKMERWAKVVVDNYIPANF